MACALAQNTRSSHVQPRCSLDLQAVSRHHQTSSNKISKKLQAVCTKQGQHCFCLGSRARLEIFLSVRGSPKGLTTVFNSFGLDREAPIRLFLKLQIQNLNMLKSLFCRLEASLGLFLKLQIENSKMLKSIFCRLGTSKVRGGGLNPGSTQVRTLGLDQRGGRPNINIKNLGSTQVQPRLNPV